MKFCLFILSACHAASRNKIEWKRRERELFRTITFHEKKYPNLKIFIVDSTIVDDKILYPNLRRRIVEYYEFGYSLDVLALKANSTDIAEYIFKLEDLSLKFGFSSYFAIFAGNYLANINIEYYNNCTWDERFMIYDYDTEERVLNDEVIFSSVWEIQNDVTKKEIITNDKLIIFNILKDFMS